MAHPRLATSNADLKNGLALAVNFAVIQYDWRPLRPQGPTHGTCVPRHALSVAHGVPSCALYLSSHFGRRGCDVRGPHGERGDGHAGPMAILLSAGARNRRATALASAFTACDQALGRQTRAGA